jgi:hypothetical protein
MARTQAHRDGSAADLPALHDAFACCTTAVLQAWRGNRESSLLSLLEARAAAEEAFGACSPEADALNIVFAAIKQAAGRADSAGQPASIHQPHPPDGEPLR